MEQLNQNEEISMSYEKSVFYFIESVGTQVSEDLRQSLRYIYEGRYEPESTISSENTISACLEELEGYSRTCRPSQRLYATDISVCRRYLQSVYNYLSESVLMGTLSWVVEDDYFPLERRFLLSQYLLHLLVLYIDKSNTHVYIVRGNRLHDAAYYARLDEIEEFLKEGDDPNSRNSVDGTLLHAAVFGGNTALVAQLLSLNKLDPNVRDIQGFTPLIVAVFMEKEAMVSELLHHGADPNFANGVGHTPLHAAVVLGNKSIVKSLLEHGARADIFDYMSLSPSILDDLRDEKVLEMFSE